MSKKKKIIIGAGSAVAVILLVIGIVFAVKKTTGKEVPVVPVSDMSWGYWGSDVSISGTVTSNASQEVHLSDKEIVQEVYVKEGDLVEVGTPLLSFDMTMTSLNLESEKLNKEGLEIQKAGLEAEISRLKKKTPISQTSSNGGSTWTTLSCVKNSVVPPAAENAVYTEADKITLLLTAAAAGNLPVVITEEGDEGQNTPTETPEITPTEAPDPTEAPSETPTPTETPGETPSVTPGENPTGTPTPSVTAVPTPTPNPIPAYELIDENSQYNGEGTREKPRFYLGKNNEEHQVKMTGAFLNQAKASGLCFWLELREGNQVDGTLLAAIYIDSSRIGAFDDTKTYVVSLYVIEEMLIPEEYPDDMEDFGDIGDDIGAFEGGYTQEELNQMISEKQKELRSINLDIKQSELTIAKIEKSLNDQEVRSTVTGIVKSVGDPEKGEVNGQAFIVVESTEGLYVQGTLSELMLGEICEGQILTGNSYETGMMFEAEIREISPYPVDANYYDGYGSPNASYYPFTAYIEDGEGLSNNEYVGFTATVGGDMTGEAIYLEKAFIREEDGKYYVYIADENDRLKKQYVTGKSLDGYTMQITSGLTMDDRITFPYGKNVKEGAKVKDSSVDAFYM